jgi:hypothetical protein
MATEGQIELFEAVKTHTSALETERDAASGLVRELLDRRLEAACSLLEWLRPFFSSGLSQAAEMMTLSSVAVEPGQDPLSTFARLQQSVRR